MFVFDRCGLGVCTIDNCMYAVGGWVGSEIGSTVEKYDPELGKWSVISHCRSLRCWMGITGDNGNDICFLYLLFLKSLFFYS